MQVATFEEKTDVEGIMLDLEVDTFMLELILKYGHYIDVDEEVKERALDTITDYQRQHLQDIFRYYRNEQLTVPTAYVIRNLYSVVEQEGVA